MQVLVEPTENGYRLSTNNSLDIEIEAQTVEEAIKSFQESVTRKLEQGARIIEIPIPGERSLPGNGSHSSDSTSPIEEAEHPWAKFAGIWKDDPLFDEWQAAIEEYRRQKDEEDDLPTATPDDEVHPLAEFAGDLKDDPFLAEWRQAMEEYRKKRESDKE